MNAAREAGAGLSGLGQEAAGEVLRVRREIDATREQFGRYLDELERRRREMTDVRLQMRRHPAIVVGLGVAVATVVGGAVLNARRARKRRAISRVRRALGVLAGLAETPESPQGRNGGRIMGLFLKAGVPVGVALVKGLLRRRDAAAAAPSRP